MKTIKEKILEEIQKQSLSSSDAKNWNNLLDNLPEELQINILEFIESRSEGLKILTSNLNKKLDALEKQDVAKWEEILKEEEEFFNQK